jgi:flagellar biosynthesis protein
MNMKRPKPPPAQKGRADAPRQPDGTERPAEKPKHPKHPESPRTATALRYDPGETGAPQVVASGRGQLAERIIALAEAHDIPLVNDPALAQTLSRLELNTEIPPELYLAVAQILAYVYRLDNAAAGPPLRPAG